MTNPNTAPVEQVDYNLLSGIVASVSTCRNHDELDRKYDRLLEAVAAHRLATTAPLQARVEELEARCASAEIAMSEVEAERDEAADRAGALEAENARLREYIAEQVTHVETRIQDGIEMGATVWRLALEDVARENRVALNPEGES